MAQHLVLLPFERVSMMHLKLSTDAARSMIQLAAAVASSPRAIERERPEAAAETEVEHAAEQTGVKAAHAHA